LFDRFYRSPDAQTRQVQGLGLGLSIVRDLVSAHGGRIWAESAGEGQGSTFWVRLPSAARAGEELPAMVGSGAG
jgi:signal transduction histidine kinase